MSRMFDEKGLGEKTVFSIMFFIGKPVNHLQRIYELSAILLQSRARFIEISSTFVMLNIK